MHKTRIDIPLEQRQVIVGILNQRLADLIDLGLQTKQAHWNVKGPNFIALHKLFDDLADEVGEWVDTVAERITGLGGTAEGTVGAVAKATTLAAYPLALVSGREHVEALSSAVAKAGKAVRAAIDEATSHGDADTADVFTEVSRGLDKQLWFLEAHLGGEK